MFCQIEIFTPYFGFLRATNVRRWFSWAAVVMLCAIGLATSVDVSRAQDEPATVQSAAAVLDLRSFPVPEDAELVSQRRLATLSYQTAAALPDAFASVKARLEQEGWTELPGGFADSQYANGTFSKQGFLVSLSASPSTGPNDAPRTAISLIQHGNLDLEKVPQPTGLHKVYVGPVSAIYVSAGDVAGTAAQCREALTQAGWSVFSGADDVPLFFKRNAVRLSVYVVEAPAQQNKTSVTYSAELMSAELDPPLESSRVQYSDSTTSLHFDSKLTIDQIADFYRERLEKMGWQATTDRLVKISLYDTLIFRNATEDMMTVEMHTVDGITRGTLQFNAASEVAEIEKAAKAEVENRAEVDRKMAEQRAASKIAIPIPEGATEVKVADSSIEFQLPSGKSSPAIKSLRAFLVGAGWKEEVVTNESSASVFHYQHDEAQIDLTCIDPGIIPAEVIIAGSGVTMQKK